MGPPCLLWPFSALKYVDPDGRVEAGAFRSDMPRFKMSITVAGRLEVSPLLRIYHFASGEANAFGSDLLLGVGLHEMNDPDYQSGQNFGHAAAVVAGVIEILYGVGGEIGGFTLGGVIEFSYTHVEPEEDEEEESTRPDLAVGRSCPVPPKCGTM